MASKEEHLRQAEHNERFFNELDINTTPYLDWVVTGIFYSAIHYIRAIAAKYAFTNISSYGDMDAVFDRLSIFKRHRDIYADYRQLKDDSRAVRYDMRQIPATEVLSLIAEEFASIKSFVMANV